MTWLQKLGKWFISSSENYKKLSQWKSDNSVLGNAFKNLWGRYTGSNLTDAQREQNSAQFELQKDAQRFSSAEAERSWDRYTEFYDKNQSIGSQIQQYKDAGVNPFSLGGNVQPQSVSNVGAPSSQSSGLSSVSSVNDLFSVVMKAREFSLAKERAEVDMRNSTVVADSQADFYSAQAENLRKNTSWLDSINGAKVREMESAIKLNLQKVNESLQFVKESVSRVSVNNNTVNVQNAQIQLYGSETELNISKKVVENLNAKQLESIMPFVALRYEAQTERDVYDANVKMLEYLRDEKLIDSDYYNDLISQAHWENVGSKRDYKWKPINDVCSNISKLALGVGSIVGGVNTSSASGSSIQTVAPNIKLPEIILPFIK